MDESVGFRRTEVVYIKEEVVDPLCELTTEENKLIIKEDDSETVDNSGGTLEFKIKTEEVIIKEEVDDPTYDLATTEKSNNLVEDLRQFVIIKSDSGPPYQIIDRFANVVIKVDSSLSNIEDLNKMLRCKVSLIQLTECVAISKMKNPTILGQAKFKCKDCGKSFTRSNKLKRHILIHTGEKPFQCSECQKCFNRKEGLQSHMKVHNGERLFECEQCQKAFKQRAYLKTHLLTHSDKKPFKCRECGKDFLRKGNIAQHMLIHSGEKPFKCEHCQRTFRHGNSWRNHTLMHEGKKPHRRARPKMIKQSEALQNGMLDESAQTACADAQVCS